MNILYVYAHPSSVSLNSILKQKGHMFLEKSKQNVIISDLYEEQFNSVASFNDFNLPETQLHPQYFMSQKISYDKNALAGDLKTEIEKITWADHIVFQFPLWWFSTPAILKGWLDRVLVKGFVYDAGKIFNDGLLKGKTASLVVTTQSPESAYQQNGLHQATINTFLHHIHHTLHFVGIKTLAPFVTYAAFNLDATRIEKIIKDYLAYLENLVENYHQKRI